ncbi:MAG: putative response regulator, CheY family [Rhodospirillales bacterium]|nr:putative response regulator, CheY family [Rhodospirillales bacterium]
MTYAEPSEEPKLRIRAGARVLVVEDESLVAMMLSDMLEDLGCRVIGPVGSRAGALELVGDGLHLDLALLDVNLGGEHAYDVADALAGRAVPFVFVSGYGISGIDPRFAHAPVLAKPFQPAALARVIGDALSGAAEARP